MAPGGWPVTGARAKVAHGSTQRCGATLEDLGPEAAFGGRISVGQARMPAPMISSCVMKTFRSRRPRGQTCIRSSVTTIKADAEFRVAFSRRAWERSVVIVFRLAVIALAPFGQDAVAVFRRPGKVVLDQPLLIVSAGIWLRLVTPLSQYREVFLVQLQHRRGLAEKSASLCRVRVGGAL